MLEGIGFDAAWAGQVTRGLAAGRVVRVDRGVAVVLTEHGPVRASFGGSVLGAMAADPTAIPCTGDWVGVEEWPDERVTLEEVLPRRSAVVRATAGEQAHGQVLAANADLVAVVVALVPLPSMARVERLLAVAQASGAQSLVVLTKADLVGDAPLVAEDVVDVAPGVEVLLASTVTGTGLHRLRELVAGGRTLALIGTSGHGKSSLTNALLGDDVLRTREIRADGRGRHTSVRRELVPLPGGGAVIDTPGLRGIGLSGDSTGVRATFADVAALAAACKFRDCRHEGEPGCAVARALDDGSLSVRRFESWLKLQGEARRMSRREDLRRRAAASRRRRLARERRRER